MRRLNKYLHERAHWPNFTWDTERLLAPLADVRNAQGKLVGKMEAMGFDLGQGASFDTLTLDALKSSEIEGEKLNLEEVRSSFAKRLGIVINNPVVPNRHVDGFVEMMLDATQNFNKKLTKTRLFNWHSALFPTQRSGMYKIRTGAWRNDANGVMQVVSGALGKEKVHFEAPAAEHVDFDMMQFLNWFNTDNHLDPVLKAGVVHLWFVTIHPFEDGNGRIARALTDLFLAKSDNTPQRFYSLSAQLMKDRKAYYSMLEKTQSGSLDISEWLLWFLNTLLKAVHAANQTLQKVMQQQHFWNQHANTVLNARQQKMLDQLMHGFKGKLSTSKWAKMTKCSTDTALRDIQDLVKKNILKKEAAGGRSTNYELVI